MRILLLSTSLYSIGGIQRYNRLLLQVLREFVSEVSGHFEVFVLNDIASSGQKPEKLTELRCFGRHRLTFVVASLNAMRRADLIILGHVNFLRLWLLGHRIAPQARSVLMLHGIEAWRRLPVLHRRTALHLAQLVAVSRYTLETFRDINGISTVPGLVIPNCIDPSWKWALSKLKREATAKGPILLSVSRLTAVERPFKGIEQVLRSLPYLIPHHPTLRYIVVGDGDDRASLIALSHQLGLNNYVAFVGQVSEEQLLDYYRRATIFVLPSAKEGFGFVFIEAMAHGLPVVAARAGATPEVVVDGVTGRLVPFGDVKALASAMDDLLANPDLRERMGASGRERVHKMYTFRRFKEHWWSLLEALVCAS
jgi:glycosyltransferase involved in cell wall biosynthesis